MPKNRAPLDHTLPWRGRSVRLSFQRQIGATVPLSSRLTANSALKPPYRPLLLRRSHTKLMSYFCDMLRTDQFQQRFIHVVQRNGVMSRKQILTKEVLVSIRGMVERDGLNTREIAQKIGCKISTLKVRCSQAKISLLPPGRRRGRPRSKQHTIHEGQRTGE